VHTAQGPIVRETDQELCRRGRAGQREFPPPRERFEALGERLRNRIWAADVRLLEAGRVERRMSHDMQCQRNNLGKLLAEAYDNGMQVRESILRRVQAAEQFIKIRAARVHGCEKEFVLAAITLVEDGFGNAGSLGDFARRRGMSMRSEDISCDAENFIVGDRFLASHRDSIPPTLSADESAENDGLTYKRALANILPRRHDMRPTQRRPRPRGRNLCNNERSLACS
jgi:hypothetical protein